MNDQAANTVTRTVLVTTVHPGPLGGAYVFGKETSGKWLRAKIDNRFITQPPIKGQVWQLTGQLVFVSKKFGYQLHVSHCKLANPTDSLLVRYLRINPNFRGVGLGDGKIGKLYKAFAEELRTVLEAGDTDRLVREGGLTPQMAKEVVDAWRRSTRETSVIGFLDKYRIDSRLAGRIIRFWGEQSINKLQENPYRLLILTNWDNAERIAQSLGLDALDPRRLIAAAEEYGYRRLNDQHTLTEDKDFRKGIKQLLMDSDDVAQQAINLALQRRALVGDAKTGYRPVGCAIMEQYLENRFGSMLPTARWHQLDLFGTEGKNTFVDAQIELFEEKEGFTLNPRQRQAVHMASVCPLSVLKGGAGVGKTATLKAIHHVIRAMNARVYQMALAGRAAQRMREMTNENASTIVGFLNRIQHGYIELKDGDLVIIDESSMLDLLLMYRFMKAIPEGVRLLFVGDPAQLPPIGPGLIFHPLAVSYRVPMTELVEIHRQAAATGIPQAADQVRSGSEPDLVHYAGPGVGVSFIECEQQSIVHYLEDIMNDLGGFENAQILGAKKAGAAGIEDINSTFHQNTSRTKPVLREWGLAESDPIIFKVNDYQRELFNGSLGRVIKVFPYSGEPKADVHAQTRIIAIFDKGEGEMHLTDDDLENVDLAYAITIHKAQGSQFKRVVIPIVRTRLLDRTLIYTALTRAIEQVIFVGDKRAFSHAVVNCPSASLRQVGFSI